MAVVELKVGMHCDRCIKSIKKAIKTIDGREAFDPLNSRYKQSLSTPAYIYLTRLMVYLCADMESYQLEKETNKVTVTGNITPEEVVKALQKIGKTVSYWGEE
ncbi:hypothetical protein QYE76_018944 [Lolium multiflorum]|uniref:HMA domain-containing protein n=1 Tax=Lolium multiflorum TaxID=4521 RepID=A0AAD8QGL7_LOLMU|nr:hypothetical protein QYE76_018944 [Lolium multiflorum]